MRTTPSPKPSREKFKEFLERQIQHITSIESSINKLSELLCLSPEDTAGLFRSALGGIFPSQLDIETLQQADIETLQQAYKAGKITASNLSFVAPFLETLFESVNNKDSKEDILLKVDDKFKDWKSSGENRANDFSRTLPQALLRLKMFLLLSKDTNASLEESQKGILDDLISATEKILNAIDPKSVPSSAPKTEAQGLLTQGEPAFTQGEPAKVPLRNRRQ